MSTNEHEQHNHGEHQHQHGHDHVFTEEKWAAMAEATEEQGEVLSGFAAGAIAWVKDVLGTDAPDPTHIIDVGSGPGVASTAFANAFPGAVVTAADSSPGMLARAAARAERFGLGDRVRTVITELPGGLAALEPADLIWASMSLHHVGDEVAALKEMRGALRPGGFVAIAEFAPGEHLLSIESPSIEAEVPGLWLRLRTANMEWFGDMRAALPGHMPSRPLEEMIAAAGFEVLGSRVEHIHLDAPLSGPARRTAAKLAIGLARRQLESLLSPQDLAYLDALADPSDPRGVENRDDVSLNGAQLIIVARRGVNA